MGRLGGALLVRYEPAARLEACLPFRSAATDPSALFVALSLSAGLVEGASVLRHHVRGRAPRRADGDLDDRDVNGNDGDDDGPIPSPSLPTLAARTILYGVASVPLGIVGASPGSAFLSPPPSPPDSSEASDDADATSAPHPLPDAPVVGTGRGAGRMRRRENEMRATTARRQWKGVERSHLPPPSRYVATLDGTPLPTPLAEAMRRSRWLFTGAGIVSFAMARYFTERRPGDDGKYTPAKNFCPGYDRWINDRCVGLWNERIKYGQSINGADLLKQSQVKRDVDTEHSFVNDLINVVAEQNERVLQLGMDFASLGASVRSKVRGVVGTDAVGTDADSNASLEAGEIPATTESRSDSSRECEGDETSEDLGSNVTINKSGPQPPKVTTKVWNATVTSVGVLGTSIRHLLMSTLGSASSVLTPGRRDRKSPEDDADD